MIGEQKDFERCSTCRRYDWVASHVCPPEWEIWQEDYARGWEDATVIRGTNAKDAAEQYARWSDAESADYTIVGGEAATFHVRPIGGGVETIWLVEGESVPEYHATGKNQ